MMEIVFIVKQCLVNHSTYSPLAASLAAYFVCQMATFIQIDVSSNTLSAAHLENKVR